MKIAIINLWSISDKSIGGTERFILDLATSLSKLGHTVDVYMFSGNSYSKYGINYISLDIFGKGIIADEYMITKEFGTFDSDDSYKKLADKLEPLIDGSKYDILHLNSPYFLKAWQKYKRIFTHHSNYSELRIVFSEKEYKKIVEITTEEGKNKLTKFVSPSEFYKKEWDSLTNTNTAYIPHAINPNRLFIKNKKIDIYSKYNLNKNLITVLLPSRLEPIQKQPMLFLKGCALLSKKHKDKLQIVLTGIDSQYEQYVKDLQQFSIKNNLNTKFIKFDSINEGYLISDIIAVPSKSESFGYSALEGLTLGITTILTDLPSFNEIANGNSQARFFNGTENDLSNILVNLLEANNFNRIKPETTWLNRYDLNLFGKRYLGVFNDEQ